MHQMENESLVLQGLQILGMTAEDSIDFLNQEKIGFDNNTPTKENLAANRAARLTMAAALGIPIDLSVKFTQDLETRSWRVVDEFEKILPEFCGKEIVDPKHAAEASCLCTAGLVGEIVGGWYPLNPDNGMRAKAIRFSLYVDQKCEVDSLTHWPRLLNLSGEVIQYNKEHFERVFSYLIINDQIEDAKARELFVGIKPVNVNQIFGSLM